MTAQQPQGAPNTTGSVPGDGPDPHRATQGEKSVTHTDLLRILRDDMVNAPDLHKPGSCSMCRPIGTGSRGLVWSTFARILDTANPSTLGTAP